MEVLCGTSRLLPISSRYADTASSQHGRLLLLRISISLQVRNDFISIDFITIFFVIFCSGRTERQATKDALSIQRMPPVFTRTPSRRQIRRTFDNVYENKFIENDKKVKYEQKSVSIPQPAQS